MDIVQQVPNNLVKNYQIKNLLGEGGSGTTYEAIDLKTHQRVALKALSLQKMNDWKVLELFEREANVLAKLNHPGIPGYLAYFYVDTPDNRCFYLVQELAEGQSLASLIQNGWHASEREVICIARKILEILIYLHSQTPAVIHRDIKPENIVVKSHKQKDWEVNLVDFGAVQNTYYNTLMRGSTVVGTYGYMAPEQFIGQAVPATDLYGLGGTLLYLLTHRSPAELPTNKLEIDFRSQIQISEPFADWLEKMIASDLENRFKSAKSALELLCSPRIFSAKSNRARQWQNLLKIGMVAVVTVAVLNHFKYPLLNRIGFTPDAVFQAVQKGDVKTVQHYLALGISANTRVSNENLLHFAGSKEVAELLIAKGADVNAKDAFGFTPLHYAAFSRIEVAQTLIAKGADINAQSQSNIDRWTPVWSPILLRRSLPGNSIGTSITPLFLARSPEMAKLLIAKGADVNVKNKNGLTPLHTTQSKAIAKILLAAGAKINIKEDNARNGKGTALLHNAAKIAFKELVQQLINNGANVVIRDSKRRTPLHYAATKEVAALLMLDINARDNNGNTPLHLAVQDNRQEVVSFLLANGAKVNVKNSYGETPLHIAILKNMQIAISKNMQNINQHNDIAALLINKGADVNNIDSSGTTILHQATSYGNVEIVKLLIAKGAIINARNANGQTALYKAIAIGHNDIAALLINNGADVNSTDSCGTTPVHQAAGYSTVEILKLLIAKGATINVTNCDGMTPLNLAETDSNPNRKAAAKILIDRGATY